MHNESMRDEVCDKYEVWFSNKVKAKDEAVMGMLSKLLKEAHEIGSITLGCYCAPKRCHADTIARYLEEQLETMKSLK